MKIISRYPVAIVAAVVLGLAATAASASVWSAYAPFTVGSASSTTPYVIVTDSTGRVGIGTASPQSLLAIQGTQPYISLTKSFIGQTWQIRVGGGGTSNGNLDFYDLTSNRSLLTLGASGNVSLGTTTTYTNSRMFVYGGPTGANIDVRGDQSVYGGDQATIELEGSDYDSMPNSALLQYYGSHAVGSTMGFANNRLGVIAFSNASAGLIYTAGDTPSPLVFGTDFHERMRINGNGKVGIGTNNPQSLLHVSAGANATTTVSVGELNVATSKSCVNMNRADGSPASFYINSAGVMVVEPNYCN